jgi:hypothetical protein
MDCFYCSSCRDKEPREVAQHIQVEHPNKHNKWAARVMTNFDQLNRKADLQKQTDRVPLTDEEKEAKRSTQRQLSGIETKTETLCLNCNQLVTQKLPVEYIQSPFAWRISGRLAVTCDSCRRR